MANYWRVRIAEAEKQYTIWNNKFKCDTLSRYWRGEQWKFKQDFVTAVYNPYVLNLYYTTITDKMAGLLFEKPAYLVQSAPGSAEWDMDQASISAGIKQDTLNTVVQNPKVQFTHNVKLTLQDSFLRFGILEVGYAADWRNPIKDSPLLATHGDEDADDDSDKKQRVKDQNDVPVTERLYFKRINPKRFRVCVSDATTLESQDWVGYYEWYYTKDLRNTPGIKFPTGSTDSSISGQYSSGYVSGANAGNEKAEFLKLITTGEVKKVWHIWDNIEHKRLLVDDETCEEMYSEDFEDLPFQEQRWILNEEGWYPIPPGFHWLSPQDEINEAREQERSYRRRFTRKFQAVKGKVDPEEIEKFASGPDGVIITVKELDAITGINNPDIGQTQFNTLQIAKDDFYTVSGNSSNIQATDRQTATATKVVTARATIRESAEQIDFSVFMCGVGRLALIKLQENLQGSLWVKYTTDPNQESALSEVQYKGPSYKQITSQHLNDGYDYEITVDIMNQTPAAMEQAQQSFVTFLSLVHQFPEIAMSPVLIRQAALASGMRNEKVIHQMQQVALLSMAAKQAQAAQQNPGAQQAALTSQFGGTNTSNSQVQQMASPTAPQVDQQIKQQLQ